MKTEGLHPCQKCGACCAIFKVSFHWSETLAQSHAVPKELTAETSPHLLSMLGTETKPVRCIALRGEVGKSTACSIYENRSSSCRNFKASYENGAPDLRCDQARTAAGMALLTPLDWPGVELMTNESAENLVYTERDGSPAASLNRTLPFASGPLGGSAESHSERSSR